MARMIIAKDGYDVFGDKRYLSLDSNDTNLMIIDEPLIVGGTSKYTHGLGYLPTTLEFFKYGTQWFPLGSPVYDLSDSWDVGGVFAEYDTNKIYLTYDGGTEDVKIFITGNSADNQSGSGKNTVSGRLKISKSGYDAETETDIRRLQFCSGVDLIKKDLVKSGNTQVVSSVGFAKVEISHNLGYVPIVIAKVTSNDYDSNFDNTMLPFNLNPFSLSPVSFYITSSKVVFFVDGVIGTFNINFNLYRNKIA